MTTPRQSPRDRRLRARSRLLHIEPLEHRTLLAVNPIAPESLFEFQSVGIETGAQTVVDSQGNLLMLGRYHGTVDFDPGPGVVSFTTTGKDLFLAKYSPDLELIDVRDLGDVQVNAGYYGDLLPWYLKETFPHLALDSQDNVYITASYRNGGCLSLSAATVPCNAPGAYLLPTPPGDGSFVAKIDSAWQNLVWVRPMSLAAQKRSFSFVTSDDVAVDPAGTAVYIAGELQGKGALGTNIDTKDPLEFVSKLNATTGNFEWTVAVDQDPYNTPLAKVSLDPSEPDAVYVLFQSYAAKYDRNGSLIWQQSQAVFGEGLYAADGAVYTTCCTFDSYSPQPTDLQMLDGATGVPVWNWSDDQVLVRGVASSGDNLYVSGCFQGSVAMGSDLLVGRDSGGSAWDGFVAHMDASTGQFVRSWRLGGEDGDCNGPMAADANNLYSYGLYVPEFADLLVGYQTANGSDTTRYIMKFSADLDPTKPLINGFAVDETLIELGAPLTVMIPESGIASGLYDPSGRVTSIDFYYDSNANREIDGADTLLGTDSDGSDGWELTIPASFSIGDQVFLARANYDASLTTNTATAHVQITPPAPTITTYDSVDTPLNIPDRGSVMSTISVSDSFVISELTVDIDIVHSRPSDLSIILTSPAGTRVNLPVSGGSGSTFAGESVIGDWTLEVTDGRAGRMGTLNGWSMTVEHSSMMLISFPGTSIDVDHGRHPFVHDKMRRCAHEVLFAELSRVGSLNLLPAILPSLTRTPTGDKPIIALATHGGMSPETSTWPAPPEGSTESPVWIPENQEWPLAH